MEEIFKEQPTETPSKEIIETPETAELTLKQWFATDEATRWVYLIFGLFAIFLIMTLLQYSTQAICCGDWDGYYHIRWSSLLWENFKHFKWLPEFTWLPLTVLNANDYADHHFLFHLFQIPFLWFFEPVTAAKIAAIFYGSLAIFSVYWLMFKYNINYLLLWLAALLTCANPFFYRMNMAKAPPLTIIYTVAGIYLLFERKYKWLLPLMFFFVWTYSLYPILFLAAMIWAGIVAWNERRFEWQPLAYTFGGMILGNLINPYFPDNLKLFSEHFFTKFTSDYPVAVGGEWYPYDGWQLLTHLTVAFIAMFIGYILFAPKNGKLPEKATFFLVFASVLFVWIFKSKRIAEYFPPFAILFAAFSWQAFFAPRVVLPEDFQRDIEPYLGRNENRQTILWKNIAAGLIGFVLVVMMFFYFVGINTTAWANDSWRNTVGLRALFNIKQEGLMSSIRDNESNNKYERAMNWANENIPAGERIYNCNWDNFPKMFFYDTKHNYVWGLDPNYLYSENPELYKLVENINSGKIRDPAPIIREKFGSRFIFSEAKDNVDFIANCLKSGWCETAYEDDEARILKIRDQKGASPGDETDEGAPPTTDELKQLDEEEKAANNSPNQTTNDEDNSDGGNDDEPDNVESNK